MPTYHYVCSKCDHEFEVVQPITAAPLTVCPKAHCAAPRWGRGKVKRRPAGGAGLLFKGSGFYITDYRSESYKAAAQKESGTAAPKKEGGDSAPAPAPKPDPKPATTKPVAPTAAGTGSKAKPTT